MLRSIVLGGVIAVAALPGTAQAEWPAHGVVDLGGYSVHPNNGSLAPGTGYSVTPAFALSDDLYLFTGYSHAEVPAKAPGAGRAVSDTYSVALKYLVVQSDVVRWLPAVTYYDKHRSFAGVDSSTQGYDLAFGLRLEATDRLELIGDLHRTRLGTVENSVTLGYLYRVAPHTAVGAFYNHGLGAGRDDYSYTALLRIYF